MKRLNNKEVYTITLENRPPMLVIPTRLKNDVNGCPRYEFEIIENTLSGWGAVYVYRCKGHYMNAAQECEIIAKYHNDLMKRAAGDL